MLLPSSVDEGLLRHVGEEHDSRSAGGDPTTHSSALIWLHLASWRGCGPRDMVQACGVHAPTTQRQAHPAAGPHELGSDLATRRAAADNEDGALGQQAWVAVLARVQR